MTGRRSEKGEHEMNVTCQRIYILVSGIYRAMFIFMQVAMAWTLMVKITNSDVFKL